MSPLSHEDEKVLDMVRSLLPSKRRHGARHAKAHNSRRNRHEVRQALSTGADDHVVLGLAARQSSAVEVRRWADKVEPFIRWCRARTKGLSPEEAVAAVASVVPKNLIGEHALGHVESVIGPVRFPRYRHVPSWRKRQSLYDRTRHALVARLDVDPAFHGTLNAAIKEATRSVLEEDPRRRKGPAGVVQPKRYRPVPIRLLLGRHDVQPFLDDVMGVDRAARRDALRHHGRSGLSGLERRTLLELLGLRILPGLYC